MTAPKSDRGTAPQHQFSESRWSQHSENAFKIHLLCRCIKSLYNKPFSPLFDSHLLPGYGMNTKNTYTKQLRTDVRLLLSGLLPWQPFRCHSNTTKCAFWWV